MQEEVLVETAQAPDTGSRIYEVGYHIVPTIPDDGIEAIVGTIRSAIEQGGGSFIAEGAPVLTRLAYEMDAREGDRTVEHDRGWFGWLKFESSPAVIQTLAESLKRDARILRSIIFQTVREETRARIKPTLREVKRTDTIRTSPRRADEQSAEVSEVDLDKALSDITNE